MVEPQGRLAEIDDGAGVVADEQQGATLAKAAQEAHALLHEHGIAYRQRLVDDEDVGIHVGDDGEGQAHVHAAGVDLGGLVYEIVADVGEGDDVVVNRVDLGRAQAEDLGAHVDVFPTGEFRVEARTELQQCRHAAIHLDVSGRRVEGAANELQQGGLARSVATDDADRFATLHVEGNIAQRPELLVIATGRLHQRPLQARIDGLLQAVLRLVVDLVHLRDVAHADGNTGGHRIVGSDGGLRGHRQTPCASSGTVRIPARPARGRSPRRPATRPGQASGHKSASCALPR